MKAKRLMVMAGGTGGHIFPGLAVAHYLMEQGWQVHWLGTADRMEAELVPKHGISIDFIRISGLRGKGFSALLRAPWRIIQAVRQAKKIMREFQPDVVLGMGGYVSGPGGIAAWLCGIPVVLHEQNGVAGLTNRWLSHIAETVLQAFPGAFPKAEVVGNPVREDVLALPDPTERFSQHTGPLRVLVFGGSQGARILNQTMPGVAALCGERIEIWHQAGSGESEKIKQAYQLQAPESRCRVTDFIDEMAEAYQWADLVICRSGALTVSEIAAAGLPAIFVPFMHKDRQQYWNAVSLEKAGAARIIEQPELTAEKISELLQQWDRAALLVMARQARSVAMPEATKRVATVVESAAGQ